MEREEIREIVIGVLVSPLLFAVVWFYCAVGTAWQDQKLCENGATQYCLKGE